MVLGEIASIVSLGQFIHGLLEKIRDPSVKKKEKESVACLLLEKILTKLVLEWENLQISYNLYEDSKDIFPAYENLMLDAIVETKDIVDKEIIEDVRKISKSIRSLRNIKPKTLGDYEHKRYRNCANNIILDLSPFLHFRLF